MSGTRGNSLHANGMEPLLGELFQSCAFRLLIKIEFALLGRRSDESRSPPLPGPCMCAPMPDPPGSVINPIIKHLLVSAPACCLSCLHPPRGETITHSNQGSQDWEGGGVKGAGDERMRAQHTIWSYSAGFATHAWTWCRKKGAWQLSFNWGGPGKKGVLFCTRKTGLFLLPPTPKSGVFFSSHLFIKGVLLPEKGCSATAR